MPKIQKVERKVVKQALRILNIDDLKTDPSYQREVKHGHKKIMAEFDETALGIPVIGERGDSSLWIVDGLQRITALRALGWTTVRAEVFASNGPEHEATEFKIINLNRTRLTPMEQFKALLTSHDETAWKVKTTVESCGFRVSDGRSSTQGDAATKYISAVRLLLKEVTDFGTEAVAFALTAVRECWPEDPVGINNNILAGLHVFFRRNDSAVDLDRLYPRLRLVPPHKILYQARQGVSSDNMAWSVADVLEKVYRKRLSPRA